MKRIYLNEAQVKTLMLLETTQKITNELKNERTKKGVIEKIKSFLGLYRPCASNLCRRTSAN